MGDSDSEAMDTLPASNGDREVLPEGTRRCSSATDLSVGQNSKCRKEFQVAPRVKLTFQRYDLEWEAYIDLDEESSLCQKDKIKVIVSPVISPSLEVLSPSGASVIASSEKGGNLRYGQKRGGGRKLMWGATPYTC